MGDDDRVSDDALFAHLRTMWQEADPEPARLADRMVAAVAVEDLAREYALLALVEASTLEAVRSDADTATLQFSDGGTSVLLHVSAASDGARRIDGWAHADVLALRLVQGDRLWEAEPGERFAFDHVPGGMCRLRVVVRAGSGALHTFQTPQFEV